MKVREESTQSYITLTDKDFLSSGGEGDIFVKEDTAYKIYHDKSKVIPLKKINELRKLSHPNIINPESPLFNERNELVGYNMKYIKNSFSLSRLITNDFRAQHNIESNDILSLAKQIIETTKHIHNKKCFIVDGNEMNYIVSDDFKNVYFIDTDSYQTPSFNATAYSPSTLDPLSKKQAFNEKTDWFSIAIVLCNLIVGINPFKGKYKGTQYNFGKNDFQERMLKGISIFNKDVKVNSAVRDFSVIPANLQKWFYSLFEKGERLLPPENFGPVNQTFEREKLEKGENLSIKDIETFDNDIIDIFAINNINCVKTKKYFYYDNKRIPYSKNDTDFIYDEKENNAYLIKVKNKTLQVYDIDNKQITDTQMPADSFFVKNNVLFILNERKIHSSKIIKTKKELKVIPDIVLNVSSKHIQKMNNILYMEFPENFMFVFPIGNKLHTIYNKKFKNRKIINAQIEYNGVQIIYNENNHYFKGFYSIDETTNTMFTISEHETESLDINFCNVNGLFVSIPEDENIIITSINKNNEIKQKTVKDKNIKTTHKLKSVNHKVHLIDGNHQKKISLN